MQSRQASDLGTPIVSERRVCPECGHAFKGNGWDGIDAHWKAKHGKIMPYEDAWPLIKAGTYDARTQAEKFAQAARDLGADQDEEAFKGVLRKLAKAKPQQPPSE